jgi:FAD/FMN-containing dehydrogenase
MSTMNVARPAGTAVIERLRDAFAGPSIGPADAGYDEARAVLVAVDRRPAAIAFPRDAREVAALVAFARGEGLPIAVRSGGHGGAGHGTVDGGLVIDLRGMRAIEIDADARTAWAQAGATTGEVTAAAGEHGLAIGFGDNGSVGIGGLTLGGGLGYLSRLHGLTIDNLHSVEVVTADGAIVTADAERHPDLFWALRGGGGNVGVATAFRFRLAEVGTVVGGHSSSPPVGTSWPASSRPPTRRPITSPRS